jgi:hypothetical protein
MLSIAYLDESGDTDDGHTFVLAGFLARAEDWSEFARAWQASLDGPPLCPPVHMTDISGKGKNGWERFSDNEREQRLFKLVTVIESSPVHAFAAIVDLPKFLKAAKMLDKMDKPHVSIWRKRLFHKVYAPAAVAVVRSMLGFEEAIGKRFGRIDFVFDRQQEFGGAVKKNVETVLDGVLAVSDATARARLGVTKWLSKDGIVPLQAADMLAWHLRRERDYRDQRPVFQDLERRTAIRFYSQGGVPGSFFVDSPYA